MVNIIWVILFADFNNGLLMNFGILKDTTYYTVTDPIRFDIVLPCSYTNNNYSVQGFGAYSGMHITQYSTAKEKTVTKHSMQLLNLAGRTDSKRFLYDTTWFTIGY